MKTELDEKKIYIAGHVSESCIYFSYQYISKKRIKITSLDFAKGIGLPLNKNSPLLNSAIQFLVLMTADDFVEKSIDYVDFPVGYHIKTEELDKILDNYDAFLSDTDNKIITVPSKKFYELTDKLWNYHSFLNDT